MNPKLISIGYSLPPTSYTQEQIFTHTEYPSVFKRMFTQSGIQKRHLWVAPERLKNMSWQELTEEFLEGQKALSRESIANCMDGRDMQSVGCAIHISCTGYSCPSPLHHLAPELGFKKDIHMTAIQGMGCGAGFPGLLRAYEHVKVWGTPALIVDTEICSATYYPDHGGHPDPSNKFEMMRTNAIFGDASVSALVGYDDDPRHPEILDFESETRSEFIDHLGYVWRDGRLRCLLAPDVPDLAPLVAGPATMRLLGRNNLAVREVDHWVIHAAGNIVIDNIRDVLGLQEGQCTLSRETLALVGNTSSTSVGITAKRLMESGRVRSGDRVVVVTIEPGLTGGAALLRFPT